MTVASRQSAWETAWRKSGLYVTSFLTQLRGLDVLTSRPHIQKLLRDVIFMCHDIDPDWVFVCRVAPCLTWVVSMTHVVAQNKARATKKRLLPAVLPVARQFLVTPDTKESTHVA